jgi:hypothetical protein
MAKTRQDTNKGKRQCHTLALAPHPLTSSHRLFFAASTETCRLFEKCGNGLLTADSLPSGLLMATAITTAQPTNAHAWPGPLKLASECLARVEAQLLVNARFVDAAGQSRKWDTGSFRPWPSISCAHRCQPYHTQWHECWHQRIQSSVLWSTKSDGTPSCAVAVGQTSSFLTLVRVK